MSETSGTAEQQASPGEAAKAAAHDIKQEGRHLAASTVEQAKRAADTRKALAAQYLRCASRAVHDGGRAFADDGYSGTAELVGQLADEVGGLADNLAQRDLGELARDVENFARRHPTVFFGTVLLAGFGITRFLKSSASASEQEQHQEQPRRPAAGYGAQAYGDGEL